MSLLIIVSEADPVERLVIQRWHEDSVEIRRGHPESLRALSDPPSRRGVGSF